MEDARDLREDLLTATVELVCPCLSVLPLTAALGNHC